MIVPHIEQIIQSIGNSRLSDHFVNISLYIETLIFLISWWSRVLFNMYILLNVPIVQKKKETKQVKEVEKEESWREAMCGIVGWDYKNWVIILISGPVSMVSSKINQLRKPGACRLNVPFVLRTGTSYTYFDKYSYVFCIYPVKSGKLK